MADETRELTLVRQNLMDREHYSPYCGNESCFYRMPRTTWNGSQFTCRCGWVSEFPADFITRFKEKWKK